VAEVHEELAKAKFQKDVEAITDQVASKLRLTVHNKTFPVLDISVDHIVPIRLRFTCDNWNESPPAIEILNSDGSFYQGKLPAGNIFNPGPLPSTGRPFICMRGSREYHTHTNHLNDTWDTYRAQDGMSLLGIVQQLVNHWRRNMK
jgi:hypothetical protein